MAQANSKDLNIRVYYEDTDAGGIVYHTSYLRFAERGRTEYLRELGIEQSKLLAEQGVAFAVRECHVTFLSPAHLDDWLNVKTCVEKISGAKLCMSQKILLNDKELVTLDLTIACINQKGRAVRLPKEIKDRLSNN